MLYERQRALLALLDALGGQVGKLDYQKLLFLWCQELASETNYDFLPYKFGAFSFTSHADRTKLIERGYLDNDDKSWVITDTGRLAIAHDAVRGQARTYVARATKLRGDALVALSYRRYPWYATRSEMAARVLAGDDDTLARIEGLKPKPGAPGVVTLGYEGRSFEAYLTLLLKSGVTILCDVRRNPISRRYGFSKSALARGCENIGIGYEHLPELGIASSERQGLDTQADYDALFETYERTSLPRQGVALARISALVQEGHRVALTCFEELPEQCHRHCVAEALERAHGATYAPLHL